MIRISLILVAIISTSCFSQTQEIEIVVQNWHRAASNADFDTYFDQMTNDAVFIGTDPTENWNTDEFKTYAKPHFDKGKAWSFTPLERHIFTHRQSKIAWFDELLDTQMGICRGSGVLEKKDSGWKIKHYVLSIAIPNENVKEITELKKKFDTEFIQKLNGSEKQ